MPLIDIYDTTLRDGAQAEDVSFSVEDKLRITQKLDDLGVHFIEGGWPGANPKDVKFFQEVQKLHIKNAKIVAFGSTAKANTKVGQDQNIRALLSAGTEFLTLFGKSWDLHAREVLRISLKRNLEIIEDSIDFLRSKEKRVFYDAEHFFDGFKANPDYALETLQKAQKAGAECIILCDTNGGTMPWELKKALSLVMKEIRVPIGIHAHNDSEMAVSNSLIAVELGATQVQGTINGFGERCGNANLCSVIPNLKFKMNIACLPNKRLKNLLKTSRFVSEIANLPPSKHQPYVGESAFAHKGGIHVHAVQKNPESYEHIQPELVGNQQRILVSDVAGRSNLLMKAKAYGIQMDKTDPQLQEVLKTLKELENMGFQFEGAEGSFELLMKKAKGTHKRFFDLMGFRVIVEKREEGQAALSEATVMIKVKGEVEHTAAVGDGPINALDNALRKALEKFYPSLKSVKLIDYKVRVLAANQGTASKVRVLIESGDKKRKWETVGVSENIMEASWQALVDSIEYKLLKDDST